MRTVAFRVPPDLIADFERIAARDDRTVSQELRRLIQLAVEADRVRQEKDPPAGQVASEAGGSAIAAARGDRDGR